LDQPSRDPHDRAVRWRQLVDLLARPGSDINSPYARAALHLIREEREGVDQEVRASAARSVAARPVPFELVLAFAADVLKVSAPVLATASLDAVQWAAVIEQADEETRRFILALHPEAKPVAPAPEVPAATMAAEAAPPAMLISDVIARIERVREARYNPQDRQPPALAEAPESASLFRWEATPSGEFAWVEGAPRGALIGRPIFDSAATRGQGRSDIARAFKTRTPFRNALLTLGNETLLAGEWQLSGIPAFEPTSGRFAGYRGIARRANAAAPEVEAPHPDSLRELAHEIKTPLNAIMGFAQIIEGQMFGPAEDSYRERAAQIVAQSHLLLGAIEDLDFAAKIQSGEGGNRDTDLAAVLEAIDLEMHRLAQRAGVEIRTLVEPHLPPCPVDGALIERLLARLVGTVIDCAHAGESLQLTAARWNDRSSLAIDRPQAMQGLHDRELLDPRFAADHGRSGIGNFGFSLRLVRGIAQLVGGDLTFGAGRLVLVLPRTGLRSPMQRRYRRLAGRGL
jgi:signal transduction histidine kinase